MFEIELPDKGLTLEFPDDMLGDDGLPDYRVHNAIQSEFYGAPSFGPGKPERAPHTLTPEEIAKAQVELSARQQNIPFEDFGEQGGVRRLKELGDSFLSGAMGTGEGLLGSLEWVAGSEYAGKLADQARRWREEKAPPDPDFLNQVASGFGSMATFFIPGIGVGKGAGMLAQAVPRIATWAGVGTASILEAATEAGTSFRESMKDTGDRQKSESAASKTFWMNMVLIPITDRLGVFGERGKAIRKSIISALMEGSQEGAQEIISSVAMEQGLNPKEFLTSTAVGAITGAGTTATIHAIPEVPAIEDIPGQPPPPPRFVPPQEPYRPPRAAEFTPREAIPGAEREAPRREKGERQPPPPPAAEPGAPLGAPEVAQERPKGPEEAAKALEAGIAPEKPEKGAKTWEEGRERPFAFDPNSTKAEGRWRLYPPGAVEKDSYFRRKSSTPGVSYVMGKRKDTGEPVIQAVRFSKKQFSEEQAAAWWEENKDRVERGKPAFAFYEAEEAPPVAEKPPEKPPEVPTKPKTAEKPVAPTPAPAEEKDARISALEAELTRLQRENKRLKYIDPKTGLLNEQGEREATKRGLERGKRLKKDTTLLRMDLGKFKTLNDTLGHEMGDKALKHVAGELKKIAKGETDVKVRGIISRRTGDEYGMLTHLPADKAGDISRAIEDHVNKSMPKEYGEVTLEVGHGTVSPRLVSGTSEGTAEGLHDLAERSLEARKAEVYKERGETRRGQEKPAEGKAKEPWRESPYVKGGKVEEVPLQWLKQFAEHDRSANRKNIDELKESIGRQGLKEPMVLTVGQEDRKVVLGEFNHRLLAMEELGYKKVPVRVYVYQNARRGKKYDMPLLPGHDTYFPSDVAPSKVFGPEVLKDYPELAPKKPGYQVPVSIREELRNRIEDHEQIGISILNETGRIIGEVTFSIAPDGTTKVGMAKGELGISGWRQVTRLAKQKYPSIKKIYGDRIGPRMERPTKEKPKGQPPPVPTVYIDANGHYIRVGKAPQGNYTFYRAKNIKNAGTRMKLRTEPRYWETAEEAEKALAEYAKTHKYGVYQKAETARKEEKPPTEEAPAAEQKETEGKPIEGEITPKKQKTYLLEAIDQAIKEAPERLVAQDLQYKEITYGLQEKGEKPRTKRILDMDKNPSVRIHVPGDGIFTVLNNKETLRAFKDRVRKHFPQTVPTRTEPWKRKPRPPKAPPPTGTRVAQVSRMGTEHGIEEVEYAGTYVPRKLVTLFPENKSQGIPGDFMENEEWLTQGHYLVRKPADFVRPSRDKNVESKPLPEGYMHALKSKNAKRAKIIAEFSQPGRLPTVLVTIGKKRIQINANYVDVIKNLHPDAEPYVGEGRQVLWKVGDQTIGSVMPLREEGEPQVLTEWLAEQKKGTPATGADVGGYASTGTYESYRTDRGTANDPSPITLDLPELVELARQLMEGNYPQVVKRLRGMAVGRFYATGTGKIRMEAGLFTSTEQAAKTLAHEIGHLVDWLPDKYFRRGNILGRIATLKNYMKHTLAPENSPGPLTDEDKKRLRKEARRIVREGMKEEKWIDEEIEKSLNLTPEDVLAIWQDMNFDKILNKELYEYVAGLSGAEKKSIVKEAFKGQVPSQLKRFARKIKEKTGRKIKVEPEPREEQVRAKYEELLAEEIRKRHLFQLRDIMEELKRFTQKWKPFNPFLDPPSYVKYRFKGEELYADAMSAMLTNPYFLKQEAPNFYEAFFEFIHRKPEVLRVWNELQNDIRTNIAPDKLTKRIFQGFQQREDEFREQLKRDFRQIVSKDAWGTAFIDQYFSVISRIKRVGEQNIPPELNPRYKIDDYVHTGSEHEAYLNRLMNHVLQPLEENNLDAQHLGFYMLLKRVATERAHLANPHGLTKARAEDLLGKVGPEELRVLEKARQAFYALREKVLIDKIREARAYSPELMQAIEDNENYATFDIVGHLEENYGREASSKIYRQIGTFTPTGNPFTATIQKDLSIMKALNKNIAAKSTLKFLQRYFPQEVLEPKRRWNGKFREMMEARDPRMGLIIYMQNGQPVGKYVPKYIADAFHSNPTEGGLIAAAYHGITEVFRQSGRPFKTLFTEANPGFWLFNIQRDYRRLARNLPKATMVNMAKYYKRAASPSFRSVFGKFDQTMDDILRGKMLISVADYRGELHEDTQLERLLKRHHVQPKAWDNRIMKPLERFWYYWSGTARAIERIPKVAGYLYLKERFPDLTDAEIAHIVRVQAGSPAFMRRGSASGLYNSVFFFSNAMKEGWRGDLESFRKNKAEFAWKVTKYNLLPKMAMLAISMGLAGWKLREMMQRATEYDKTNYVIVPLGMTPQGKAVYMRLPQDETGRLIGGIAWKLINRERPKLWTSLLDYMAGQAPTLHPLIGVLVATVEYFSGRNSYDRFRGRHVVPEQVFIAGGKGAHVEFAKWLSNQMGAGIVHRFQYDDPNEVREEVEKLVEFPIVNNIIGRFIKVTDYGKREQLKEDKEKIRSLQAQEAILAKQCAQKLIDGRKYTKEEMLAFVKRSEVVDNYTMKALFTKYGVYAQEFFSSQTTEEKLAVLKRMLGDYALRESAKEEE